MALPPLPATAQEILACFGDEFIDAKNVTRVVEGDPGICAKLLGLSNSAYFGLAEPVNDISEAISRVLGVDTVRSLVLAMAIQQSFNSKRCPAFDVEEFWRSSLMTAECCRRIASADSSADDAERDLAYSAGLCHNLGLMALSHIEPGRTDQVLKAHKAPDNEDSLALLFDKEFKTNHKVMTAELSRIWSLPAPMVTAYECRACPDLGCDDRLSFVVSAGVIAVRNAQVDEHQQISLATWCDSLGIPAEDVQSMADFGDEKTDQLRSLAMNMSR